MMWIESKNALNLSWIESEKNESNPVKNRDSKPFKQGDSNQFKRRENNQLSHGGQSRTANVNDGAIIGYLTE